MKLPTTPSSRLDGRRALVTGASSGIGLGAAVALAEAGAHVTLCARGADRLNAVADAMRAKGLACDAVALDVGDVEAVERLFADRDAFHVVVNAAGIARHSPAVDTTAADFDAVAGVNLRGAYFLSTAAARTMMDRGIEGSIVHISSQMGHVGGQDRAVYCATKFGVEGMVKAMAIEWGPSRIRINTVCPTFVRTPLTEQTFERPERVRWIEEKIKLGRVAEVSDIVGGVIYLAGDQSKMVTGTSLLIDGGWTAD